MTAPSNANTSGLEVVAWRWEAPIPHVGDGTKWGWSFASHWSTPPSSLNAEPLVTAASAQAEIDAERATKEAAYERIDIEMDRATAAEARADRLAKALERAADDLRDIGMQKPQPTNSPDPEHENYLRRVLISLGQVGNARARAALQQETQL